MNLSIKCPKMYSPNIQNESVEYRSKDFYLKGIINNQICRIPNLNFEVRTHRIQLCDDNNCYDIMYNRIKDFTFEKRGLFTKIIYKIKIYYDNNEVFEIKKKDRSKIEDAFKILNDQYSTMKWQIIKGGSDNFHEKNNSNNLEAMFNQKKKALENRDKDAEMYLNNIEDIFKYFDELRDIFEYFKNKNKDTENENDERLDQLMENLGYCKK